MQKKLLTITAGLLLSATAVQANEVLIVQPLDGTPQEFELADIRHISFVDNEMVVTPRSGMAVFFVLNDLSFGFEKNQNNVSAPTANNIDLSVHITPQGEVMISSEVQVLSLAVYDMNGRRMLSSNSEQLNVLALSAGVYLLSIETAQGRVVKRFIKQR